MNPVFHAGATQQTDPTPSATPLPTPARPIQPSPALTSAPTKSAKPALLSLKLNLPKSSGEADGHNARPGSPSSRSTTKVQRSITEAGGQKRAIDGTDGPGSTSTKPGKRQKMSTPPGSPRGSTPSSKQLVKQSRPVTDLKAMAGLSPRRFNVASPPSSPGAVATGEEPEANGPSNAAKGNSSTRSMLTETGKSAPRWRSTSYSDVPEGAPLPSPSRPVRSSSLSLDLVEKGRLPDSRPAAPAKHDALASAPANGDMPDENQWEFIFLECDYGQNGELIVARQDIPNAEKMLASSGAALPESPSLSSTLIAAEILPKAKAQRDAAASYIVTIREQLARTADSIANTAAQRGNVLADAFELGQAGLETGVILVEMALERNSPDDAARFLNGIGARLAELKSALAALTAHKHDESASAATVAARQTLSESVEAMEAACKFGIGLLTDEQASRVGNASTSKQSAQQEDPVITPANKSLLDDLDALDALMDQKILPVITRSVPTAPPKQQ